MTDNTKKSNNLFNFATSELSQDAFFCWSLNWLAVKEDPEDPYYKYGKAMLDLFLGEHKKDIYKEVEVLKQFNRIDVLVLFKDNQDNQYALIIEDKTNTSEHNEQIKKYREKLNEALSKNQDIGYGNLPGNQIYTAYVKTGIMYSRDLFMKNTVNTVVDFDDLFKFLNKFHEGSEQTIAIINSNIFIDYYEYLQKIDNFRNNIRENFDNNHYVDSYQYKCEEPHVDNHKNIFVEPYAQYYLLKELFGECDKNLNSSKDLNNNEKISKPRIYAGSNNDGSKWTQYCFWEKQFESDIFQHKKNEHEENEHEYYALFWRIDNATMNKKVYPYLALRYYDKNINKYPLVSNDGNNQVEYRHNIFEKLKNFIDKKYNIKYTIDDKEIFIEKNSRVGSVEKNLLYIPIRNLDGIPLDEISKVLQNINSEITTFCRTEIKI